MLLVRIPGGLQQGIRRFPCVRLASFQGLPLLSFSSLVVLDELEVIISFFLVSLCSFENSFFLRDLLVNQGTLFNLVNGKVSRF